MKKNQKPTWQEYAQKIGLIIIFTGVPMFLVALMVTASLLQFHTIYAPTIFSFGIAGALMWLQNKRDAIRYVGKGIIVGVIASFITSLLILLQWIPF